MTLKEIKTGLAQDISDRTYNIDDIINNTVALMQAYKEDAIEAVNIGCTTRYKISEVTAKLYYIEAYVNLLDSLGVDSTYLAILKDEMSVNNILSLLYIKQEEEQKAGTNYGNR